MTLVWFIRHGESEANAGLPTLNPTIIPLTERGRQQAKQVARYIPETPSLIVTSPYIRTQQTARPARDLYLQTHHEEWPVQEFTYLSPHHYQNTTTDDRRPIAKVYWQRNDPHHVDGAGAESFAHFMQRVYHTLHQLHHQPNSFVLIFSHGQFMRGVLLALLNGMQEPNNQVMKQYYALLTAIRIPNGAILSCQQQGVSQWWMRSLITEHITC